MSAPSSDGDIPDMDDLDVPDIGDLLPDMDLDAFRNLGDSASSNMHCCPVCGAGRNLQLPPLPPGLLESIYVPPKLITAPPAVTAPSNGSGSRPPPPTSCLSHESGRFDGSIARRNLHRTLNNAITGKHAALPFVQTSDPRDRLRLMRAATNLYSLADWIDRQLERLENILDLNEKDHFDSDLDNGPMSARSSSGSWSGGGGAPADIIDLDKFMRGGVRPSRADAHNMRCGQLVVDAGGVDRKPVQMPLPPGLPVSSTVPPALTAPSSSSGSRPPPHGKRFSHDSGLSDGSYARRKHRSHKRVVGDNAVPRSARTPAGSSNSLRAFRAVCERALLDQQAQIARVAQLCERLTERAPHRVERPERAERAEPTDTSDVSSSSRSTRDQRRKDKHRTEECKTYKIIMNKLDELNRLFAVRARSPSPPLPAPARRATPSSGSITVSDKLVATEPEHRTMQVNHNTVTVRSGSMGGRGSGAGRAGGGSRLASLRAVANTCALDIAPRDALPTPPHRNNIATESVVQGESRERICSSGVDPRCGFDLEDPVHLYSQAKRLQALPATTRRARSVEPCDRPDERLERYEESFEERFEDRFEDRRRPRSKQSRDTSLCALCRGYWRALRHYLAAQIFCYPDTTCH